MAFFGMLGLLVLLKLNFAATLHRSVTLSPIWIKPALVKLALASSFRADPARLGQVHAPTFAAVEALATRAGTFPETYPEAPEISQPGEWRAEYDQDVGYGVVMGALWRLCGSNRVSHMIVLQVALDTLVLLALAWAATRVAGRAAGVFFAVGYLQCYPVMLAVLYPIHYYWPVIATGASLAFFVLVWSRGERVGPGIYLLTAALGLLLALVGFVRSATLFVSPALGLGLLALPRPGRARRLGLVAVLGASVALGLLPVSLRNAREFGTYAPRRGTFWHSLLCGIADADPASGFGDDLATAARIHALHGDAVGYVTPAYEAACHEEATRYLDAHPGFYARRFLELLWLGVAGNRSELTLSFLPLLAAALLGLVRLVAREPARWLPALGVPLVLWASIASGVALVLLATYTPSYRLGADVMLLFLFAVGLGAFVQELIFARLSTARTFAAGGLWLAAFLGPRAIGFACLRLLPPVWDEPARLVLQGLLAFALGRVAFERVLGLALGLTLLWPLPSSTRAMTVLAGAWLVGTLVRALARPRVERAAASTCELCGDRGPKLVHFARHGIVRCPACGLVYYPERAGARAVYTEAYFKGGEYLDYPSDERALRWNFERRLEDVSALVPRGGRLLEIGCAYGYFLDLARARFEAVRGIDVVPEALARARAHGHDVVEADFLELPDEPDAYDAICLWDTIEHLEQPVRTIEKAARWLKPGGVLVLTTGDVASAVARARGASWRLVHPPTHLFYFSPGTLGRAAEGAGLRVERVRHVGYYRSSRFMLHMILVLRARMPWLYRLATLGGRLDVPIYLNLYDIMLLAARKPAAPARPA